MTNPPNQSRKSTQSINARRHYDGPVILKQGFRIFFLMAAFWAAFSLVIWLGEWLGYLPPFVHLDASLHAHEMLFGFAAAMVSGFLLTAVPNWTGRLPVRGGPLLALALLWLVGRLAISAMAIFGWPFAPFVDSLYLFIFAAALWREIIAGKNWRNVKIALIITGLAASNIWFHLEHADLVQTDEMSVRAALSLYILLMAIVGGRVIPSFTRNILARRGATRLPAKVSNTDRFTLVLTFISLASWTLYPQSLLCAGLALMAFILHLERLSRWRGLAVLDEPLLWAMHLGYLWISIGFFLLAAQLFLGLVPHSAVIHAFAVGAIGTLGSAIMTRASRGHSRQAMKADMATTGIYVLISLAAIGRISASIVGGAALIELSGLAWISGFGLFVIAYWSMLTRDKIDQLS